MFRQFIFAEPKHPSNSKRRKTTGGVCNCSVGSTCTCGDNCQCGDNCKCHKCSSKNNSASSGEGKRGGGNGGSDGNGGNKGVGNGGSDGSGGNKGGGNGGSNSSGGNKGGGNGGSNSSGGGSGGSGGSGDSSGGSKGGSGRRLSFKPLHSVVECTEDGTYLESEQRKGPISIEAFFFSSGKRKCKKCAWGIHHNHNQRAHVSQCPKCKQLRPIDDQPFDRLGILERINDGQTLTDMFINQRLSMSLQKGVSKEDGIRYLIDYLQQKIDNVKSGIKVGIAQIKITPKHLPLVISLKERLEEYLSKN